LKPRDVFLGNPDVDLPEKAYSIQTDAFFKIQSYKQIGAGL
jgi:5-methylcytosine-specific restriction protein B